MSFGSKMDVISASRPISALPSTQKDSPTPRNSSTPNALASSRTEFTVKSEGETTSYKFAEGKSIVNVGDVQGSIKSRSEATIVFCGPHLDALSSAHFLVGAEQEGRALSFSARAHAHTIEQGGQCLSIESEEVSPLDLFESVRIESVASAVAPPSPPSPSDLYSRSIPAENSYKNCAARLPYSDVCVGNPPSAANFCLNQCFDKAKYNWTNPRWGAAVGSINEFKSCYDMWEFSLDTSKGCSHRILHPLSVWGEGDKGLMQVPAYQTFGPNCKPGTPIAANGACLQAQSPQIPIAGLPGVTCTDCWISLMSMTPVLILNYATTAMGAKQFSYAIKLVGPISASFGITAKNGLPHSDGYKALTQLISNLPNAQNQFRTFPSSGEGAGNSVGECMFPGLVYKADLSAFTATLRWVGSAPRPLQMSLTTSSPKAGLFLSNNAPFSAPMDPLQTSFKSTLGHAHIAHSVYRRAVLSRGGFQQRRYRESFQQLRPIGGLGVDNVRGAHGGRQGAQERSRKEARGPRGKRAAIRGPWHGGPAR